MSSIFFQINSSTNLLSRSVCVCVWTVLTQGFFSCGAMIMMNSAEASRVCQLRPCGGEEAHARSGTHTHIPMHAQELWPPTNFSQDLCHFLAARPLKGSKKSKRGGLFPVGSLGDSLRGSSHFSHPHKVLKDANFLYKSWRNWRFLIQQFLIIGVSFLNPSSWDEI